MAIFDLMNGSDLEQSKMVATYNREFNNKGIFRVFEVFNSLVGRGGAYYHSKLIIVYPLLPIDAPSNQSVGG